MTTEQAIATNIDAERSVLATCLTEYYFLPEALELLQPQDFYQRAHQDLFRLLGQFYQSGRPINELSLAHEMGGELTDNLAMLAGLLQAAEMESVARDHARIIKALARQRRFERLVGEAVQANREGDEAGLTESMERLKRVVEDRPGLRLPQPYLLAELEQDILEAPQALAFWVDGLKERAYAPRAALSVIAALSGVGKTTFMLNCLAKWLDMYPEEQFYFFSYEEPRAHIALKLIMLLAGVERHPEQNYNAYVNYLKHHRGEDKQIETALEIYQALAEAGRLIIDDTMPLAEDLAATIGLLGKRGGVGAVLVDYIQRIYPAKPGQARYLDMAYVARLLRETAVKHELAIITGSQLSDEGKTREAQDIYHEAALVLKIIREGDKEERDGPLSLFVDKQRAGLAGFYAPLSFERSILRMGWKGQPASGGRWS